jgi:hypothetical protein
VYLVLGSGDPAGTASLSTSDTKWSGVAAGDQAGNSVSFAGDVDGDGLDEILVGAWENDDAAATAGAAYLLPGDAVSGALGVDGYIFVGESGSDYAGQGVSKAGDFDGDGLADVAIGASRDDDGGRDAGAAYVIFGATAASMSLSLSDVKLTGGAASDYLGWAIGGGEDVDDDGYDDLLVGAGGYRSAGGVFLVRGPGAATVDVIRSADAIFSGVAGDTLGAAIALPGDIDGDGLGDIVLGSETGRSGGTAYGAAYVFLGGFSGTYDTSEASGALIGSASGDYAGDAVSAAGDWDGDGFMDLVVGAERAGTTDAGAAYVVLSPF